MSCSFGNITRVRDSAPFEVELPESNKFFSNFENRLHRSSRYSDQ